MFHADTLLISHRLQVHAQRERQLDDRFVVRLGLANDTLRSGVSQKAVVRDGSEPRFGWRKSGCSESIS